MEKEPLYNTGDVVTIVDEWDGYVGQDPNGVMNEWLCKKVTIRSSFFYSKEFGHGYYIEEDNQDWAWYEKMFKETDFKRAKKVSFDSLKGWEFD